MTSMVLGGAGLAAMAVLGGSSHNHGTHGSHATGGHGHALGHHTGTHGHHNGTHAAGAHHAGATHAHAHGAQSAGSTVTAAIVSLMSPRVLFTLCLGIGATGVAARSLLGGVPLLLAAIAGGVLLDRAIVTPMWNAMFRFESKPALTLESSVAGEATVVSTFDKNGQGLISVELDGQMLQVLGTLRADDRLLGARVAVGTRVRIDAVDEARNRCTVSLL